MIAFGNATLARSSQDVAAKAGKAETISMMKIICAMIGSIRFSNPRNSGLRRAGEIRDDIPVEVGEAQNLALEDAFLITVGAESHRTVLDVGCRTDAVTLDSFAAQIGHVRGSGTHRRD